MHHDGKLGGSKQAVQQQGRQLGHQGVKLKLRSGSLGELTKPTFLNLLVPFAPSVPPPPSCPALPCPSPPPRALSMATVSGSGVVVGQVEDVRSALR